MRRRIAQGTRVPTPAVSGIRVPTPGLTIVPRNVRLSTPRLYKVYLDGFVACANADGRMPVEAGQDYLLLHPVIEHDRQRDLFWLDLTELLAAILLMSTGTVRPDIRTKG